MIKIDEKLIKFNFSSRNGEKIKYIVIHDTGNKNKGANADAHYKYFNGGNRKASAHYFVDDTQILRVIKDKDKSWNCGDGRGKYGITNENSIGIEMCVNSDGDFNKTLDNTIKLTVYLMQKYNIQEENLVRHYDASRKICPHILSDNNWAKWYEFKSKVINMLKDNNYKEHQRNYEPIITMLYKSVLKRDPDLEGLNYWTSKIHNNEDLGNFVIDLLESKEYLTNQLN